MRKVDYVWKENRKPSERATKRTTADWVKMQPSGRGVMRTTDTSMATSLIRQLTLIASNLTANHVALE